MTLYINGVKRESDIIVSEDLTVGDDATITDDLAVGGDITLTAGGSVITTANGDLSLKPHGTGLTKIGDAASPSYVSGANGQLFVSDKLECADTLYLRGTNGALCYGSFLRYGTASTWQVTSEPFHELITIPVGQGSGGVVSSTNMASAYCRIRGATARVTQAPGGGATTFTIGITGGAADGLLGTTSTALNTTGKRAPDAENNAAATTITITTDGDVTGTDMIIRVVLFEDYNGAPAS